MGRRDGRALAIAAAAVSAAVVSELRKSPEDRTWHGRLLGFVPYDLRVPTVSRLRATVWDPGNPNILVPHAFGVGWSINFGSLAARLGRSKS